MTRSSGLEQSADFIDFGGRASVDLCNDGPMVGYALDKSFGLQVSDHLSYDRAAHPQLLTKITFSQSAARFEVVLHDRCAESVECKLSKGGGCLLDPQASTG